MPRGWRPLKLESEMRLLLILVCCVVMSAAAPRSIRDVDWRNFSYPLIETGGVPGEVHWMAPATEESVSLINGRYVVPDDCRDDKRFCPSLTFDSVSYGVLSGVKSSAAVVVLSYHTGGTANWQYVYILTLESHKPRLMAWLRTGSKADRGLRGVSITAGDVLLAVNDPEKRQGDCCSAGSIITRYRWSGSSFSAVGNLYIKSIRRASIVPRPLRQLRFLSARTLNCHFWTARWRNPIRWPSKVLLRSAGKSSAGNRKNGLLITATPATRVFPRPSDAIASNDISAADWRQSGGEPDVVWFNSAAGTALPR